MRRVLPARVAKLGELQPASGRLLVLRRRIVPVLTIRTLQCNDLAHKYFLSSVANHLGWQAAHPLKIFLDPTRRDAGLRSLQPVFLKFPIGIAKRSGTRSSFSIIHEIAPKRKSKLGLVLLNRLSQDVPMPK